MARNKVSNESWSVSYTARDKNTNEDIMDLNMRWENLDAQTVCDRLNTWLTAVKIPLEVSVKANSEK